MGYVNMPGMLSSELIKALAGKVCAAKGEPSPKDEMAAAWKEYMKEEKHENKDDKKEEEKNERKCDKKEDKKHEKKDGKKEDKKYMPEECCYPKKVKFIFLLNNAVVINVNAVCEEDNHGSSPRRAV